MCKPKPGPRCASHASLAFTQAQHREATAAAALVDAEEAVLAAVRAGGDKTAAIATRDEVRRLHQDARTALDEARSSFESTPRGQQALAEQVARLRDSGRMTDAADVEARLEAARRTRARQEDDLRGAQAQAATLAGPLPPEAVAALAASGATVQRCADDLADRSARLERARDALDAHRPALEESREVFRRAQARVSAAHETLLGAQQDARAHLTRLYRDHGVNPRLVGAYVQDAVDRATEPLPALGQGGSVHSGYSAHPETASTAVVGGPLRVKVKASGPDKAPTLAARAAADGDAGFNEANTAVVAAVADRRAALQAQQQVAAGVVVPAEEHQAALSRQVSQAQMSVEDAQARHGAAVSEDHRLRALVGAGAGVHARSVDLKTLGDEVVRLPDGSTNAWMYTGPAEGLPHGRYVPVVGVQPPASAADVNGLVLSDGRCLRASTTSFRTFRGRGGVRRDVPTGLVVVPVDGAGVRPLRAEGDPRVGFHAFRDSTG